MIFNKMYYTTKHVFGQIDVELEIVEMLRYNANKTTKKQRYNMDNVDYTSIFKLCTTVELDFVKTFECGQCFRWNPDDSGAYCGVAAGHVARVFSEGDYVYIQTHEASMSFWHEYFDLETYYDVARRSVEICDYMRECAEYGAGIRILRQDKWEALCSFIISQCNNIPRIKTIVERLCSLFGERIETGWGSVYTFPEASRIALLTLEDLAPLRSGYRAKYILSAAKTIASGELDLEATALLSGNDARRELKRLQGVGDKVANCAVLFGLHCMDAFPVDTWIKKALSTYFEPDFDPACLGEYAGLAQQYMFYHAREKKISSDGLVSIT